MTTLPVSGPDARERRLAAAAIALICLGIIALAFTRSWLSFGTESDFLGGFVPEAQRLLNGEPLRLDYHPPLYAVVIALANAVIGDWVTTGLLISLLSAAVVLWTSFVFFYELGDRQAAWGAMLGLVGAAPFLTYAGFASSDLFFLALFTGLSCCLLVAARRDSPAWWLACGLLCGAAVLTRTNGVSLFLLLCAPWLYPIASRRKAANVSALAAGIAVPLLAWIGFASLSGAPLTPTHSHSLLALTYYSEGPDRLTGNALMPLKEQFDSLYEVVAHNPTLIARTYLRDLFDLVTERLWTLISFPLFLFVVPGLFFLLRGSPGELLFYLVVVILPQILLLNLKAFEARFYLFLVPLAGAAIGACYAAVLVSVRRTRLALPVVAVLALCGATALALSSARAFLAFHSQDEELGEAVPAARAVLMPDADVVSWKAHLAFYTGTTRVVLPQVGTLDELRDFLAEQPDPDNLYLYFGSVEQRLRPGLAVLKRPGEVPPWLELVAASRQDGLWLLYKYRPAPASAEVAGGWR